VLQAFINIFRIPELWKRVRFTLFMLIILQLGALITVPGVDTQALEAYMTGSRMEGTLFGMLDMFTGGAFKQLSFFALGVMPYITASIIFQLLAVVWPYLEELSKKGEEGRKKITQYTRYATVGITALQASMLAVQIKNAAITSAGPIVPGSGVWFVFMTMLSMTTGTIFIMWMGEQITERGIGNGISLIIFANIVARFPQAVNDGIKLLRVNAPQFTPFRAITVIVLMLVVIAVIVVLNDAQRRITIKRGRQVVGRKVYGGNVSYLPIRINQAGVIPVIFASSILMLPTTVLQFIQVDFLNTFNQVWMQRGGILYTTIDFALIVFFCFFYTAITFNPKDVAENLQKYGITIPGYSHGRRTEEYIERILVRVTVVGAIMLAVISVFPDILYQSWKIPYSIANFLGGTGLIIVVGVALDTVNQIENHLRVRRYETFRKKSGPGGRRF
jgi:preprotein translocase subunit SecY